MSANEVEDFREDIRARLEPGAAKLVVLWSDGRQDEFEVIDVRFEGGTLVAKTASGEQVVVSPALEYLLVGAIGREELQP